MQPKIVLYYSDIFICCHCEIDLWVILVKSNVLDTFDVLDILQVIFKII